MPTYDELPAWELRGERPPYEAQYERERARLRELRRAAAREKRARDLQRRKRTSVPPPTRSPR